MIVEFCGMPGGGKSTIAKRLASEEGFEIIMIEKGELGWLSLQVFLAHPLWYVRLLGHIFMHAKDLSTLRYKIANLLLQAGAKYEKAKGYPKAILDQGYFQSLISIAENPISRRTMESLVRALPRPDTLVFFDVGADSSNERIEGRDYIVRRKEGDEAFKRRLAVMRQNAETLKTCLSGSMARQGIISADGPLEPLYSKVRDFIYE